MGKTWVTDLTHFAGDNEPDTPRARRVAEFFGNIAAAGSLVISSREANETPLRCRKRPKKRPCPGRIDVRCIKEAQEIHWSCTHCNDNGVIRGWQCTEWDLSDLEDDLFEQREGRLMSVNVTDAEYKLLLDITHHEAEAEIIVRSARRWRGGAVLLGSPGRLSLLNELVQAELETETRSSRRAILLALELTLRYELKAQDKADSGDPQKGSCPFCKRLREDDIIAETKLAAAISDAFPVSPGHMLIVPKRHEPSYFGLTPEEVTAILELVNLAIEILDAERRPDGYNIGINEGAAAGQTVSHVHVHLIPRYKGDAPDPRGGIRWIMPERAKYWKR
ncbi:MAG: HIT family protein [Pseudomonadota bacterium]